ncbi:MAG TPA: xanthine dehydrogenase family protein subunit M [Alphaproteobacteria bacterium]|nr:xanthine dehydrogenase family protein subunit M [Alphaproteobacteria bacterium]
MKPAPFEYAAPNTLSEALSVLADNDPDEVKILAGGQSLMPLLNMRLARPRLLLDLTRLDELEYVREIDGGLAIGAMTTKRAIEESELVRDRNPLFWQATVMIGHPQIRNRGTVGGSMVQADPAAEYPAAAVVLDIELVARGAAGERTIPADEFFVTYLTTSLEPGEILTEVRVPDMRPGTGWSIQEVARRHGDFAIVGAAATLRLEGGRCADPRIVVFGATDRARRYPDAEALLAGQAPDESAVERAATQVAESIEDPIGDVHASEEYRRDLARVLTRRALLEAAGRAG